MDCVAVNTAVRGVKRTFLVTARLKREVYSRCHSFACESVQETLRLDLIQKQVLAMNMLQQAFSHISQPLLFVAPEPAAHGRKPRRPQSALRWSFFVTGSQLYSAGDGVCGSATLLRKLFCTSGCEHYVDVHTATRVVGVYSATDMKGGEWL